jgi:hypothetical protein
MRATANQISGALVNLRAVAMVVATHSNPLGYKSRLKIDAPRMARLKLGILSKFCLGSIYPITVYIYILHAYPIRSPLFMVQLLTLTHIETNHHQEDGQRQLTTRSFYPLNRPSFSTISNIFSGTS